jgi:hypothetical protein
MQLVIDNRVLVFDTPLPITNYPLPMLFGGSMLAHQVIETWRISHRVNEMFIDHIPAEGMRSTLSTRGGRDVARQFDPKDSPSRETLKKDLALSTNAIAALLERGVTAGGVVRNLLTEIQFGIWEWAKS